MSACAPSGVVYVEPPWQPEQAAIVIVTDLEGAPLRSVLIRSHQPTNLVFPSEEVIVYARTYEALVEPLDGCLPVIGGSDGTYLGEPASAWRSTDKVKGDRLELEVESTPREITVRLLDCITPPKPCSLVMDILDAAPRFRGYRGVATISDELAIISGELTSETDTRTSFVRVEAGVTSPLPGSDLIRGPSAGLDRFGDRIVGAAGSVVFTMDLAGTVLSTSAIGFGVISMDTGTDGSTFFVSSLGEVAILGPTETEPSQIDAPPIEFPPTPDVPEIAAHSRDRAVMAGPDHKVWLYERGQWRRLLEQVEDEIDAVSIDDEHVLVDLNGNPTLLVDDASGDWIVLESEAVFNWITATASHDGRFLLVGQTGQTGYYNGERFCLIPPATPDNLTDVDFSPNLGIAYAVGENKDAGKIPPIIRIQLPVTR